MSKAIKLKKANKKLPYWLRDHLMRLELAEECGWDLYEHERSMYL